MNTRALCLAWVALATNLAAQAPAPPAAAVKVKGPSRAEFRIGGFMVQGERNYDFYNAVTSNKGSIRGVDVLLRAGGAGIYVRSLSGTFGTQPKLISADARVLLFPPVFTVFGGMGKRGISGIKDKVFDFITAGVSSTTNIGGTGLRTHISGGILIGSDKSAGASSSGASPAKSKGMEAEAAVYYRPAGIPLFMMLGYRTETFNGQSKSGTTTIQNPEEVRGLRFGGGIQFGGR